MEKKYFYVLCAQVAWRTSEESEALSVMPVNVVASFPSPIIRKFNLAQMNAQAINNLSQMIGERVNPDLVANVTIMSISPLGFMTEDEFHAQPSQTQVEKEVRTVVSEAADKSERA
ncbi:hypothetical protein RIVERRIDER_61 [Xanthomonas phage RiverRider]|uniref:Uncharacterized protein n=1 Tax=Xanthomonas phage RiverRider TaxID=2108116 RepID=A0A2P1JUV5_9CAUD|nr:hypothetical protein HWB58_gp74 [Xanthomonas phage RiverRider]AVO23142.1 hypothetical protein RIVERRIDER_61 [Xanthomonas phage RiverRider]